MTTFVQKTSASAYVSEFNFDNVESLWSIFRFSNKKIWISSWFGKKILDDWQLRKNGIKQLSNILTGGWLGWWMSGLPTSIITLVFTLSAWFRGVVLATGCFCVLLVYIRIYMSNWVKKVKLVRKLFTIEIFTERFVWGSLMNDNTVECWWWGWQWLKRLS